MSFFTDGVAVNDPNKPHGFLFSDTQAQLIIDPQNLGTQSYTVECWFKRTSTSPGQSRLFAFDGYNQGPDLCFSWDGANVVVDVNNTRPIQTGAIGTAVDGNWHHLAVVYNAAVPDIRLFYDGTDYGSQNGSYGVSRSRIAYGLNVGGEATNTYSSTPFTGKITNFRVVVGTAVYTSNFTVPTVPLSNIAGTTILLQPNVAGNAIIDKSNNAYVPIATEGTNYESDTPFPFLPPPAVYIYERPVVGSNMIRFNWTNALTTDATSYVLSCIPTDGGSGGGQTLQASNAIFYTFSNLTSNKSYTGSINASNAGGIGASTLYLNVITGAAPEPPQDISFESTATTINLRWSSPTSVQTPPIGWYVVTDSNTNEKYNTLVYDTQITIPFSGIANTYTFRSVSDAGYGISTIFSV